MTCVSGRAGLLAVWVCASTLMLGPGDAAAQRFAVDAGIFGGSASIAWARSAESALGLAVGAGVPQIDETLVPDTARFEEYVHVGAFYRRHAGVFEADLGARVGIGDLFECGASDCWPGYFVGGYAAVFAGWEHVKLGVRVVAVSQQDPNEPRAFAVALTPFLVRIAFGR